MDKSSAIGLAICILLFFILLNINDLYSSLNTTYCSSNLESAYCHALIP